MFIYFSDCFFDGLEEKEEAKNFFEDALISFSKGGHFVCFEPKSADPILLSDWLGQRSKAVIKVIQKRYSLYMSLLMNIGFGVCVTGGEVFQNKYCPVVVPWTSVGEGLFSKVRLVGENLVDSRLYEHAAKHYLISKRLFSSVSIAVEGIGGGGSTTADVFEGACNEGCVTVCFCDSDRGYEGGGFKETAGLVMSRYDRQKYPFSTVKILDSKELENLIPVSVYQSIYVDGEQSRNVFFIGSLLESCDINFYPYLDIKEGIKWSALFGDSKGKDFSDYWRNLADWMQRSSRGLKCECRADSRGECECFLVPGISGNALSKVLELFDGASDHRNYKFMTEAKEWLSCGEVVTRYACSPKDIQRS